MKTNFSVSQIADIAKKVHTYKTLIVTTRGQMFRNKVDAEEAVRTLNLILEDANEHVGIIEITADQLSAEKLKMFGKAPSLFGKLFDEATIPVSKNVTKKEHKRTREEAAEDASEIVDDVEIALGMKADPKAADKIAANKIAADKIAADKIAANKIAADKIAADKIAADKIAADKIAADKLKNAK